MRLGGVDGDRDGVGGDLVADADVDRADDAVEAGDDLDVLERFLCPLESDLGETDALLRLLDVGDIRAADEIGVAGLGGGEAGVGAGEAGLRLGDVARVDGRLEFGKAIGGDVVVVLRGGDGLVRAEPRLGVRAALDFRDALLGAGDGGDAGVLRGEGGEVACVGVEEGLAVGDERVVRVRVGEAGLDP